MLRSVSSSLVLAAAFAASGAYAQGSANVVGGTLFVDAGPGSVQCKITVNQNGDAQVFDVPGLPSPIDFRGVRAIDYRSGVGSDQLQFEIMTATPFATAIRNPSGATEIDLKYEVLETNNRVALTNTIALGAGADLVQFEVDSRAQDLGVRFVAETGAGASDVFAKVNAPDPSQRLDVAFGTIHGNARDNILLEVISAARTPNLLVGTLGGGGDDLLDVFVDQSVRADVLLGMVGDLGDGPDLTDIRLTGSLARYGHYGTLLGGLGNDELKLFVDTDIVSIADFDGGAGDDVVRKLVTGGMEGAPRLSGSDGNDLLQLQVAGRRGGNPILNGGPGFDIGSGYGTFISIEQID